MESREFLAMVQGEQFARRKEASMLQSVLGILKNRIVISLIAILGLGGGAYAGAQYMGWDTSALQGWFTTADVSSQEEPAGKEEVPPASLPPVTEHRPLMVGTFNIQRFGPDKSGKPEVMKRLRELALPFDILAIQEVVSKDLAVIRSFVEELNKQHQVHFNYVTSPRLGESTYKEQYAFVYDASRVELVEQPFVVSDPEGKMQREPLVARFRVRTADPATGFSFVLVNVHTQPEHAVDEMNHISDMLNYLEQFYQGEEDDILVLGDFNLSPDKLQTETKFAARPAWKTALSKDIKTNTRKTESYDNVVFSSTATTEYQNRSGVIDLQERFTISAEAALEISDHMPIWAAFSLQEDVPATKVAVAPSSTAETK